MSLTIELWPRVPDDFDNARRFAVEYEIEVGHALAAAGLWFAPDGKLGGRGDSGAWQSSPAIHTNVLPASSAMKIRVSIEADRLRWEIELRAGDRYESPSSVAERFAADLKRLETAGDGAQEREPLA